MIKDKTRLNAGNAGKFKIGGELEINRLGFGAMRITGPGIWGQPENPEACKNVLKRLLDLGVNFIDTADCYGPEVSENLIHEVLHPYQDILVATKGGLCRSEAKDQVVPLGRPEYLRFCVAMSMRRLNVGQIDLWQLHRIDPKVPQDEQFSVIKDMRSEGKIRHVGLSAVTIAEIEAAQKYFPVATVQNQYNFHNRKDEDVLNYCEKNGIGFIPFSPLGGGRLGQMVQVGSAHASLAQKLGITSTQLSLAWLLKRSPNLLPIAGTSQVAHLEENVAAASVQLSEEDFEILSSTSIKR